MLFSIKYGFLNVELISVSSLGLAESLNSALPRQGDIIDYFYATLAPRGILQIYNYISCYVYYLL